MGLKRKINPKKGCVLPSAPLCHGLLSSPFPFQPVKFGLEILQECALTGDLNKLSAIGEVSLDEPTPDVSSPTSSELAELTSKLCQVFQGVCNYHNY